MVKMVSLEVAGTFRRAGYWLKSAFVNLRKVAITEAFEDYPTALEFDMLVGIFVEHNKAICELINQEIDQHQNKNEYSCLIRPKGEASASGTAKEVDSEGEEFPDTLARSPEIRRVYKREIRNTSWPAKEQTAR